MLPESFQHESGETGGLIEPSAHLHFSITGTHFMDDHLKMDVQSLHTQQQREQQEKKNIFPIIHILRKLLSNLFTNYTKMNSTSSIPNQNKYIMAHSRQLIKYCRYFVARAIWAQNEFA